MSIDRLHPADLEALAEMTAERLATKLLATAGSPAPPSERTMLDPKALAKRLGVSAGYVYEHAVELGGVKIGTGPKARWRFDPGRASEAIRASTPGPSPSPPSPPRRRSRQQPATLS